MLRCCCLAVAPHMLLSLLPALPVAPPHPVHTQVIDGQQRLTTLVMLLSYLRAWSATQPGLESLAERVHRMLFIPADPLNPAAKARCGVVVVWWCGCGAGSWSCKMQRLRAWDAQGRGVEGG